MGACLVSVGAGTAQPPGKTHGHQAPSDPNTPESAQVDWKEVQGNAQLRLMWGLGCPVATVALIRRHGVPHLPSCEAVTMGFGFWWVDHVQM